MQKGPRSGPFLHLPQLPGFCAGKLAGSYTGIDREEVRPYVLGTLCDALSYALRAINDVRLGDLPRMADFAKLSVAAGQYFGWRDGDFLAAYEANQEEATEAILEIDSVASAIVSFIRSDHPQHGWVGTATELLAELNSHIGEDIRRTSTWPKTPAALGNRVKRAHKLLRRRKIFVSRHHTGEQRQITIKTSKRA